MDRFIRLSDRLSRPFILNVVRRGMTVLIPMVLAASLSLAIICFPLPAFETWFQTFMGGFIYQILSYIKDFSFSYFSVMLVISISISYVLESGEPIETSVFAPPAACISFLLISRASEGDVAVKLGTQGSIWALVISLLVSWGYNKLIHSKLGNIWNIPAGHDTFFRGAMRSFLPLVVVITCSALASYFLYDVCKIDNITYWLGDNTDKLLNSLHSGFAEVIASAFIIHLLWFFGIHGSNVVEPFMSANTAVGHDIIFSKTFFDVFVLMGGCGTSVCIILAILIFCKRGKLKNIARAAALPVFLNINEIITFGLPIIWNPILLIPFMLVPLEASVIAYSAIKFGIVAPVVSEVTWTTPIIASGYIATRSISGSLLQIVIIILGALTYAPFLRMHEESEKIRIKNNVAKLIKMLREAEENGEDASFLDKTDALGVTANMLMNDLYTAVEGRQPYLVYQPQFKADGTCIGAEALLRWRHPLGGYIYPPLIIYLAKKGGFLDKLEEHIFDMACNAIKQTEAMTDKPFKMSVNITARSLKWDGLEDCIAQKMEKCGVTADKLWIEITEQDLFSRDEEDIEKITRLREKGHKFFIDDFGMGRTSIFYIQSELFDGVKLDGGLVKGILNDNTSREIVSSVIDLSNKLGMTVIAEFVETKEICEILDELGCDYHQGYYFSKPVGLEEFQRRLNDK
ncbi:MAG: PTS sugar transporter subunit IIC/EAL domain-containing protein [Firmicutes bacterium]|nr:PTS sugar transporter subunit IIC/EAL domain-containing protein [Bacillota bacterium]